MEESLGTNWRGIKSTIKEMAEQEKYKSGIATAYIMRERKMEFTNAIDAKHPIFKKQNS